MRKLKPVVETSLKQMKGIEFLPTVDLSKYGIKSWDYANVQYPFLNVNGTNVKLTHEDWHTVFDDVNRQEFEGMY